MIEKIKYYPNYSINHSGDVFNNKTGRKLKQTIKKGYCGVFLYNEKGRKYRLVHRLIAEAFIPNPNNYPEINHKDENSLNNSVDNLEWCTSKYNSNYGTHREKIRQRMLTNNPFKNKKHTTEAKIKMRQSKLGKTLTEEHKSKISESCKGRKVQGKAVLCVELNKVYLSVMDAERETGIPNANIVAACKGKRKTAGGYHWQYI